MSAETIPLCDNNEDFWASNYDNYEKIRLVLGDNNKAETNQFIERDEVKDTVFIGKIDNEETKESLPQYTYEINENAFGNIESYIGIYEKIPQENS